MQIDYVGEAKHQSIGVDFNVRYNTGDWFYTPFLSRGNSPTVFSIRKVIYGRYGVCIVSSIVVVRACVL